MTRALDDLQRLQFNWIFPFQSACAYKLVKYFHERKTSLSDIELFFNVSLLPDANGVHFQSRYTWRNKIGTMIDQPSWIKGTVDFHLQRGCIFYYRGLEGTIQDLLQPRAYAKHLVFALKQEFDEEHNRLFIDMHTVDWWWRTQVRSLSS